MSGWYIGLMSGTSLDGVDGVLARFENTKNSARAVLGTSHFISMPPTLKAELMALQGAAAEHKHNELERASLAGNQLAYLYAECVQALRQKFAAQRPLEEILAVIAIGSHGQTVRHQPALGYTTQIQNAALLAELTGLDVVADFRSRDVAAGGQGAPLVPAFHAQIFAHPQQARAVLNLGGIANLTLLQATQNGAADIIGFDTGPANVLIDLWCMQHLGVDYDAGGAFAAQGTVCEPLLANMMSEPFFALPPPKSTGRDVFNPPWLAAHLKNFERSFANLSAADVAATLTQLSARSVAQALSRNQPQTQAVYACGGGVQNPSLMKALACELKTLMPHIELHTTAALGVPPNCVEALAFAWLAQQCIERKTGNLPSVTGARGTRVLGAIYPA